MLAAKKAKTDAGSHIFHSLIKMETKLRICSVLLRGESFECIKKNSKLNRTPLDKYSMACNAA